MSRIYFTTPIYYVTAPPHLGHAYTTVVTDALARYHRLRGDDTRYLTGTDEHGQKVERMAAERGKAPQDYANEVSRTYISMWQGLGISNDDFIRTTDADHEAVVQELWRKMVARGDIYLGHYEGWYCVACEQFYTEKELASAQHCPVHHRPVELIQEESYFFRLSAYEKPLLAFYDEVLQRTGRPFIEPEERMNEVLSFVRGGLEDLSVSRTTFKWGVRVPGDGSERHVVYVWIDALTNYYSATRRAKLAGFWDDDVDIVHVMGKEITRFHAVYWPAMLLSAGLRPPSKILAHGWWTVDGEKMSKTVGNVVDPLALAADLGSADAFRYFVMREIPLGADGDFSHQALLARYNAELANDLGNLLNRTLGMVKKYFADEPVRATEPPPADVTAQIAAVAAHMVERQPSRALEAIWAIVRSTNTLIERRAPWKQERAAQEETLGTALETCRVIAHLLSPFLPERAAEMLRQLGLDEPPSWPAWRHGASFRVRPGAPLFPRLDPDRQAELLAKWAPKPEPGEGSATTPPAGAAASQHFDTAKQHDSAASQQAATATSKPAIAYEDFARLDLRVARIAAAEKVPRKDRLLRLELDLGGERRTVVAGIAAAYSPDELLGRKVLFLANLKPAKIGGILSEGMILAAGDPDVLALSALDRDCPAGTRVK